MKKVQEYILKGKRIYVGLEDSKKTWKICIRWNKMVVNETSMPAEFNNLRQYFKKRFPECKIKVMYEAGFSGFWLHDLLTEEGIECIVTPPHTVTDQKCNKVKTDKIDARRLARNLENLDYKSCFVPDLELRQDRQVSRTFGQIQRKIVSIKNQIRRFFEFHGYDKTLKSGPWSPARYKGLKNIRMPGVLQFCLDVYLKILSELQVHKKMLEKKLQELSKRKRYSKIVKCFSSFPGIGILTAIRLALEWGDLRRFKTRKGFAEFLGLTPSEFSTGDMERRGHITRQGNGEVRSWLIEAAWIGIRKDPVLLQKFKDVWSRSSSKKKAIVAVARKMAVRMRSLVLSNQIYTLGVIE